LALVCPRRQPRGLLVPRSEWKHAQIGKTPPLVTHVDQTARNDQATWSASVTPPHVATWCACGVTRSGDILPDRDTANKKYSMA
jgi:hypothetical protein